MKTTVYTAIIGYLCGTARQWANDLYLNPPDVKTPAELAYSGPVPADFSPAQTALVGRLHAAPQWCREIL